MDAQMKKTALFDATEIKKKSTMDGWKKWIKSALFDATVAKTTLFDATAPYSATPCMGTEGQRKRTQKRRCCKGLWCVQAQTCEQHRP